MAQFTLIRNVFDVNETLGDLYHGADDKNAKFLSVILEDVRRLPGVKVQNETCIPAGCYKIAVSMSTRFRKLMPMLTNMANGYEIKAEGIGFKGIRMHNGNNHNHTAGCLLYQAAKGVDQKVIDIITEDARRGIESWIEIVDEI